MSGFNKERLCNLIRLLATPVDGEGSALSAASTEFSRQRA